MKQHSDRTLPSCAQFVEDAPEAQTVPPMAARIRFIFTCLPVLFTLFFLVAGTLLYTNKDHVVRPHHSKE